MPWVPSAGLTSQDGIAGSRLLGCSSNSSHSAVAVQVAGALLSMGDAHIAQGDSEFDGTGIETSITGRFKITLHKKSSLPKIVQVSTAFATT